MRMMLRDMDKFNQNLNSWDVSNVTDMINLFRGSGVLMEIYLAGTLRKLQI